MYKNKIIGEMQEVFNEIPSGIEYTMRTRF